MNKSWKLIPKILAGEKSIESRWYQTRRIPWDSVSVGDTIFFKDSGELITASAIVSEVFQFTIDSLEVVKKILKTYGKEICLVNDNPETWERLPKYCILMRLHDAKSVTPSAINKKGFGSATAWVTIGNIKQIKA